MATVTKANLATYLAGLAPSATPYPIEITETVASDWRESYTAGTAGSIINASTPSGVYLDLGLTIIPSSVINMSYTFYGCTSLTTAPVIPSSVTNMGYTFRDCTSLTTAPVIPNSVINMGGTFRGCTELTTAPVIPNSVISMSETFRDCTSLTTIQNFAVDVDNCNMTDAFSNCPALANIYVTTLTESSWHLLYTDTGATGTDYTIYNPDGTVAGSGTVAGTSQVLTLYGKSDELVISANITPTLAVETATSQVQWHKSGLPYDDELMIFNAKNPDTVISNFITVNRAGEEFLGNSATATTAQTATLANKAKDSYPIPTDAVLQYSFDEIKQLPDNPAGTVYKRDNDWTTVYGWGPSFSSSTLDISGGVLVVTPSGTQPFSAVAKVGNYAGKKVAVIMRKTIGTVKIQAINPSKTGYYDIENFLQEIGENRILIYAIVPSDSDYVRIYCSSNTETFYVETVYIGDGSYLDPVIDNSYSEAHAENHGVIPVDGVCGKAGYFNNSYMIAPRPALGDDITIYFWAKLDSLGTQIIVQSRTVLGQGLSVFQISGLYRLDWRQDFTVFYGYTPPVNSWHHVCMKMNATTKVLKINGEVKSILTGTYVTTQNLASTIWSGFSGLGGTLSTDNHLTGALDGLKIVPRYTTDDEDIGEYKARANLPKFNKDIINVRVSLRHGTTLFEKTWAGLTGFSGDTIWTDGDNIYFSFDATHYVLDKSTSTWTAKTWIGLTNFYGDSVWTDGDNIYYSSTTTQYVLNKTTSTWSAKTWAGLTSFSGFNVWTDGDNIYYSSTTTQYVLNKTTSTWTAKVWAGLTDFSGARVWTDGDNIYYSTTTTQYVLNKTTSTWTAKVWAGLTDFSGNNVWTDGDNIYYSSTTTQYVLPATRHNYVDENKYQGLFRVYTRCNLRPLSKDFVFSNE